MTSKIDKLFGSSTRVKILCELMLNPDRSYFLRELSRRLKIPYSMLYKEIKNLAGLEIVKQERKGRITLLTVNKGFPGFEELRMLIVKTAALGDIVKGALEKFRGIKYALIYGSFASGEVDERGDVDLMIVGSVDEEELAGEISKIEERLGREINYILWEGSEFLSRSKKKHHLLAEIAKSPIVMLVGGEGEFRRTVEG
jgi:predicted nucleotidyltransferase